MSLDLENSGKEGIKNECYIDNRWQEDEDVISELEIAGREDICYVTKNFASWLVVSGSNINYSDNYGWNNT